MIFQRFLWGLAALLGLSVVIALFTGVLLLMGLYYAYHSLVLNGLEEVAAITVVSCVMAMVITLLVVGLVVCVARLRALPNLLIESNAPITSRVGHVGQAFIDGLLTRKVIVR